MLSKKYLFFYLFIYFLGLWIFFKSQFISLDPIKEYSNRKLIDNFQIKQKQQQSQSNNQINNIDKQLKQQQKQSNLAVNQVVLIIIDALRYDYLDQIKFFKQTLKNHPKTTLIKKSIVGQPTMTTQRIQSLMTGSQIFSANHIFETFLSTQTKNDNIIDQLYKHNKSVAIFGDDTWTKIFKINNQSSWVCDSTFNIRDYDSCDQLIYKNLHLHINNKSPPSSSSLPKYSLLIGHFLSLDHIGHTLSNIKSLTMKNRMQKISLYLKYLIQIAGNNVMFIITGDHGMRQDGNHGGGSKGEVESLMMAYYKYNQQQNKQNKQQQQQDYRLRYDKNIKQSQIHQIDITSTLSILLDIPNPINNIGCPIIQILPSRFKQKLFNIQYNTLQQYKSILSHYYNHNHDDINQSNLSILISNNDQTKKCIENITKYMKYSQQSQQKNNINNMNNIKNMNNNIKSYQIFKKAIRNKQFIKENIQQSKCIKNKLSMNQPQYKNILVAIILMIIAAICMVIHVFYNDIINILYKYTQNSNNNKQNNNNKNNNNNNNILKMCINLLVQILSIILSLFSIYFSWYLIRNQSSYLLIIIILFIFFIIPHHTNISSLQKFSIKFSIIIFLIILTQLQPIKINQYQLNIFNLQLSKYLQSFLLTILNNIGKQEQIYQFRLTGVGKRLFQKGLKEHVKSIVFNIWVIIKILKIIKKMKMLRYKKKKYYKYDNNNKKKEFDQNSNMLLMQLLMMMLMYLNLVLSSFIDIKQYNLIYFIRYTLIILLIFYHMKYPHQYNINNKQPITSSPSSSIIILFISSIFFTTYDILTLIIFIIIIQKCLQLSYQLTLTDNNLILISLICEYYWWILGNRYQYSSIDIKKSYILTDQFNIVINSVLMMIWFVLPYIVAIWLALLKGKSYNQNYNHINNTKSQYQTINKNYKLQSYQQHQSQQQKQQQIQQINKQQQQQQQQQQPQPSSVPLYSPHNQISQTVYFSHHYYNHIIKPHPLYHSNQFSLIKLLFIPLFGLLSSVINLTINNGKILFTVVYVPLTLLSILKVIGIVGVICIVEIGKYIKKRIKMQ